jgi:hypothetical protein
MTHKRRYVPCKITETREGLFGPKGEEILGRFCFMKNAVFWTDMSCRSETAQHFVGIYCPHLQGTTLSQARIQQKLDGS